MKASQQRPRIRNMLSKREDVQSALKEVTGRWTYDNEEERKRQIYKGEVDAGVGDMVIDWQDFTIVETISFDEDSAATSSAAAVHLTGTATTTGGEDGSDEDMDMDDDMDEDMEEDEEDELNVVQVSLGLGGYFFMLVVSCLTWGGAFESSGVFLPYSITSRS